MNERTSIISVILVVVVLGITSVRDAHGQSFELMHDPLPGVIRGTVALADYDADGDLDLFIGGLRGVGQRVAEIYRNDDGNYTIIDAPLESVAQALAYWGDYDRDGDLDLLVSGAGSVIVGNFVKLYRNDSGAFVSLELPFQARTVDAIWSDHDLDGDLDIIRTDNSGEVSWAENVAGEFVEREKLYTNDAEPQALRFVAYAEDFDGDLIRDLVGRDEFGDMSLFVKRHDGYRRSGILGGVGHRRSVTDFDLNGTPDLLVTEGTGSFKAVMRLTNNGAFARGV